MAAKPDQVKIEETVIPQTPARPNG